ncbi:exported hypothetical protein [Pseudomonas sp. IT-P218]
MAAPVVPVAVLVAVVSAVAVGAGSAAEGAVSVAAVRRAAGDDTEINTLASRHSTDGITD